MPRPPPVTLTITCGARRYTVVAIRCRSAAARTRTEESCNLGENDLVVRGYVALYRFLPSIDTLFVLAIRHHREKTFPKDR